MAISSCGRNPCEGVCIIGWRNPQGYRIRQTAGATIVSTEDCLVIDLTNSEHNRGSLHGSSPTLRVLTPPLVQKSVDLTPQ